MAPPEWRLYVQGIPDRGSWDPKELVLYPEEVIEKIMHAAAGDRKVRTVKELEEAILVSERGLPTIKLWITEDLTGAAQKVREE